MSELDYDDHVVITYGNHAGTEGQVVNMTYDAFNGPLVTVLWDDCGEARIETFEEWELTLMPKKAGTHKQQAVYIAGPMRGIPEFNFPAFRVAAATLRNLGYKVFSPHEHDEEGGFDTKGMTGNEDLSAVGFDLRSALRWDLDRVMDSDSICLLPGYEKSTGAAAEIALAKALGTPVKPFTEFYHTGGVVYPSEPAGTRERDPITDYYTIPKETVQKLGTENLKRLTYTTTEDPGVKVGNAGEKFNRFTGETRTESSTGGQKGMKLARFDLIPAGALNALAEHYGVGAAKYDDNQWRKGYEYSKSYAAMQRHLNAWWGGEDIDEETGSSHLAAAAWHCFTLLTFMEDHPDFDDRYKA